MTIRRFRGGVTAARCARRVVREELQGALPRPKLADVELLVSELATNSVRHAGCDESGELEVEAAVEPDRVRVRLLDCGAGFEARTPEPPRTGGGAGTAWCCSTACRTAGACSARTASASGSRCSATSYRSGMSAAPERDQPEGRSEPELVRKLRARQQEHKQRGRLYRWAFVLLGVAILCVGIAMLALPGPAFVVIPIGLAILSLEFAWAERLLEKALVKGDEAKRKASEASRTQKILSAAAIACAAAAALAAALVWDIPYLPV